MKEPVQQHETPPNGWTYLDPRTSIKYSELALTAILQKAHTSWIANDIEIPQDWQAVIRHEICEQRPDIECREIGEPETFVTIDDIARFGATAKNWLADGGKWVEKSEAERRASICSGCQFNKPVKLCFGCSATLSWLAHRIGWPTTSRDAELSSCKRCKCLLKLKCHIPLNVLDDKGVEYPEWCWAKQPESNQPI